MACFDCKHSISFSIIFIFPMCFCFARSNLSFRNCSWFFEYLSSKEIWSVLLLLLILFQRWCCWWCCILWWPWIAHIIRNSFIISFINCNTFDFRTWHYIWWSSSTFVAIEFIKRRMGKFSSLHQYASCCLLGFFGIPSSWLSTHLNTE